MVVLDLWGNDQWLITPWGPRKPSPHPDRRRPRARARLHVCDNPAGSMRKGGSGPGFWGEQAFSLARGASRSYWYLEGGGWYRAAYLGGASESAWSRR